MPHALAPLTRQLDATVRHMVHPKSGDVIDHQAAHLQDVEGVLDEIPVVGEQPGLQAKLDVVRGADGSLWIGIREQADQRRD